jgi:glycosyltransferase involved in cell wall biosynthesis
MNEVNLVGCTDAQINYYSNLQLDRKISTTYLKFLPHINHTAALKIMKNYDILVLPMPINTSYNGMPLKLLEYLSSGRITIIAENDLLKPIFGSQFKPYWYLSGDENSLYKMIKLAIQDENLQNNIQQGIEFARQFTWEARTDNILKSLNTEL